MDHSSKPLSGQSIGLVVLLVVVSLMSSHRAIAQGANTVVPTEHLSATLPAFELGALDGRTWTNASLAGKTVFINVWATWCKPCNAELPYVQRLYEKLQSRQDIVFITINIDEKPERTAPFVKAKGYTFPVLYGYSLIRTTMKLKGIPRNWVLNTAGVIRVDEFGYTGRTDWVEWAERQIASVHPAS